MNTQYEGPVGNDITRCDLCARACHTVAREFRYHAQPAKAVCHRGRCRAARLDARWAQEHVWYRWADFREALRERYDGGDDDE